MVALGTPTDREKTQWYFQRYVAHLPAAGEMVLFDRSWYNRAGVERVMGFAPRRSTKSSSASVPEFERMLIRSGIILIKYWFSVSPTRSRRRAFRSASKIRPSGGRSARWTSSLAQRWDDYSMAKDEMFRLTDIKQAPWYVVEADNKKRARLNASTICSRCSPTRTTSARARPAASPEGDLDYVRPPIASMRWVPEAY